MPLPYISIDNFRAFKEKTEFEFAPITILTGTNSSGKSSLVDGLRVLQNYTDEFTEPNKNDFWDKIINFKEDYFNYRIPNFSGLPNYINSERRSIFFEFKSRFVGMVEDVIICFEFIESKDGVNGILKSLKYKNDKGEDFFSMVIEAGKSSHLEVDFGFFYQKFQEEIKKEIGYYDTLLSSKSSNSSIGEPAENIIRQAFLNPFKSYGRSFNPSEEEINKFEAIKDNFEKDKPFYDITEYCEKNGIEIDPKNINLELPSEAILENSVGIFLFNNWKLIKSDAPKSPELESFIKRFDHIYEKDFIPLKNTVTKAQEDADNARLEMEILYKGLGKAFKSRNTDAITGILGKLDALELIAAFDISSVDTTNLKFNIPASVLLELSKDWETPESRLKKILKEKLSIDMTEPLDDLPIRSIIKDPIDMILWCSNEDGSPCQNYNEKNRKFLLEYFEPIQNEYTQTEDLITDLGHLFYDKFVNENILNSIKELKDRLEFDFIPSIRNSPDRFYTKKKEAYFENILVDFYSKYHSFNEDLKNFINRCLLLFGIGDRMEIKRDGGFGLYSIVVVKKEKERETNLMDLGYGISQVMPILLKIALTAFDEKTKSIIIEEPETNLHPALQSKLADMFVEANKMFGVQFIIETHSEYLMRKLQYLTAKAEIKPEDTQIYYFYHPDNIPDGEPQVKKININEGGVLSDDFGRGFFDEADKIAMSIWSMNQSQKN